MQFTKREVRERSRNKAHHHPHHAHHDHDVCPSNPSCPDLSPCRSRHHQTMQLHLPAETRRQLLPRRRNQRKPKKGTSQATRRKRCDLLKLRTTKTRKFTRPKPKWRSPVFPPRRQICCRKSRRELPCTRSAAIEYVEVDIKISINMVV